MSTKHEVAVELAGGKRLVFETGRMAKQASGAALVTAGETVVLATAVASPDQREGIDFFPLTVDYREYTYAGGRIPGGFIKREGRPSEKEILTSRQIDRPIRPLFPEGFRNETQVIALVFSADKENDPDVVAINAAAAALALSDIPFGAIVGAVRVGRVDGEYIVNPTYAERSTSSLNIMVVGHKDGIVMIEAGAKEEIEEVVIGAIEFGHEQIKKIVAALEDLASKAGKTKRSFTPPAHDDAYYNELQSKIGDRLKDALDTKTHAKTESYALVKQIKDELAKEIPADDTTGAKKKLSEYYELLRERTFREQVTKDKIRPDRRAFDEIRAISIETSVLPRTHGSALFTRGETQALVTATLGTPDEAQRMESYEGEMKKPFMLHYNFPPFSVGETGRMTGVGRREVGHGALAERAISAVLPDESQYAIRIVSDILESNGSSSMASVCGASLALFDAGVNLKGAVAGVAMGLVKEGDDYAILTDIAGAEDHYGDMDFKVAGTRKGITALQMDIKIGGLTRQILSEAMDQARRGRFFLLDKMDAELGGPRTERSKYAPRIETVMIPTDKIRDLIGKGGATIRGIVEQTGAKIDVDDTGKVSVASSDAEGLNKALAMISDITAVPEVGKVYLGKVVRLAEFGAFVELFPGTDGLLHISEIAEHRVKDVKDELREGDQVMVKVLAIEGNRIKLSRKALIKEQKAKLAAQSGAPAAEGEEPQAEQPQRSERGDRGDRRERPERQERPQQPRHEFDEKQPTSNQSTILIEGGEDFDEEDGEEFDEENEPNFNRADGAAAPVGGQQPGGGRPQGGGAGANNRGRRRRRRGGRPGQGGGHQG
ncbi:polyribonucleotide nucleotidyltransferase [Occallatibacter riparius]|uniref:Polyribonucleotide nucleotidyltransferase n=1 Tax=Occallatibacter riparius TaxID=1002689 RepID=A0A9J7BLL7_9BACT|nr:polyribonucleotide nucleotidyltransferase [Occallatibacter riparius]UWZ83547.1 polyribonucleotide nucleotidyltransferase [Occallatibacter riparius]